MNTEIELTCPNCDHPLSKDSLRCRRCSFRGSIRHGITSFISPPGPDTAGLLSDTERTRLAQQSEMRPIRDVAFELCNGHEHREAILNELYNIRQDSWRVLAAGRLKGRCLDVRAGYGRRSHILAEILDEVYAVDPCLDKLRVLKARDDYHNRNVKPIHAHIERLPFPSGSFDTVVADLTGQMCSAEQLEMLNHYLSADGSLVVIADGIPVQLGLAHLLPRLSKRVKSDAMRSIPPISERSYRRALGSLGFTDVNVVSLLPSTEKPKVTFEIDDHDAVRHFQRETLPEKLSSHSIGSKIAEVLLSNGGLSYVTPNYCILASKNPHVQSDREHEYNHPYIITGRSRSIVLNHSNGRLQEVFKIPNCDKHISINEREHRVLSKLRSTAEPITETLPKGEIVKTRFGPARRESPAEGVCLRKPKHKQDPEKFRYELQIGYQWLIDFQRTFGSERFTRSSVEINRDLSFDPLRTSPETTYEPVKMFRTPVHGDFLPGNVFIEDGTVATVIDWEYGALSGWPIVDAGLFVLSLAKLTFGGVESGIETLFYDENEYSKIAEDVISEYCTAVGISQRAFMLYLPTIYLHRLHLDWNADAMSTYTGRVSKRLDRVERLREIYYEQYLSDNDS